MRYRLRFLLQEFDLDRKSVTIGRGPHCAVTIDDPMMSREHVRIDLSGSEPTLEDLHSRNGTILNGRPLVGAATLEDGDRIRIGTQELVFVRLGRDNAIQRTTGALRFCQACAIPYPSASATCPHCGTAPVGQGVTTSVRDVAASGWTFHLLSEVVERAIEQNRLADAERMMSRGVTELEEQLDGGLEVEPARVLRLADCAARLGGALAAATWLEASARLYDRTTEGPGPEILSLMDELADNPQLEEAVASVRRAAGIVSKRPSRHAS